MGVRAFADCATMVCDILHVHVIACVGMCVPAVAKESAILAVVLVRLDAVAAVSHLLS